MPCLAGELNAAAWDEATANDGLLWRAGFDEIVEDAVDDGFVEGGVIAIAGEIEFERLCLHTALIRNVEYLYMCGIWLAGHGAE